MMFKKKLKQEDLKVPGDVVGIGIAPASSVMSDSLKLLAANRLPDEKMAVFEEKWTAAVHDAASPSRKKPAQWKMTIGVAAAAAVIAGIGISVTDAEFLKVDLQASLATQTTDEEGRAAAFRGGREIILIGSDCACGHINPQGVELANLKSGDGEATWQIRSESDGAVLFTGSDANVSEAVRKLSDTNQNGRYLLLCTFRGSNESEVVLERAFLVGNYSGDAPA
ncbi:MAG: hypothetical protein LBN12_07995 [Clostridiales Family XIII bacterium]|jgi:hypothetical protein|nr:hypothetical protein [Clostridiales Family XIII bacterium]